MECLDLIVQKNTTESWGQLGRRILCTFTYMVNTITKKGVVKRADFFLTKSVVNERGAKTHFQPAACSRPTKRAQLVYKVRLDFVYTHRPSQPPSLPHTSPYTRIPRVSWSRKMHVVHPHTCRRRWFVGRQFASCAFLYILLSQTDVLTHSFPQIPFCRSLSLCFQRL